MFIVSYLIKNSMQYAWLAASDKLIILLYFAVLAIVLVGLLYGFFIAIICGQRINERHYHVLAKQELTKVCYLIAGFCLIISAKRVFFSLILSNEYFLQKRLTRVSYEFLHDCD